MRVEGSMSKEAFRQAARYLADTAARVEPNQWDGPGLGVWSVRDLVGHTSRSITRVEQYATQRAERADISSAAQHYHVALAAPDVDEGIAESGRAAGGELGDEPASFISAAAERAVQVVDGLPEATIIAYTNGGIRLDHYLQTRVLELTVHTLDLQVALGIEAEPPQEALSVTLHLLADLAADSGHGGALALAATGRGVLPDRFSVLG